MTRWRPAASASGQELPKGPRRPSSVPGSARQIAALTGPTARTVCSTGPPPPGAPLIEIGTSPTPKA